MERVIRAVRVRTPTGRADELISVVSREIGNHRRALELDDTITKVSVEVFIGRRTGDAVKVRYQASSETDLTEVRKP